MFFILYLLLTLIVALLGSKRKFGFWGYFFASLLLTPVVGLIMVIGSGKKKNRDARPRNS